MSDGRIVVLVENSVAGLGLVAEHGLSFWIELGPQRILFDTGQGQALLHNAGKLGSLIRDASSVVLSHGHYDHTGGLSVALSESSGATVHLHRAAVESKYVRRPDGSGFDIGIPPSGREMIRGRDACVWIEEETVLPGGLHLTGAVPRLTDFEDTGGAFFRDAGCTDPDPLIDDISGFIETASGSVVLLGCAHAGVINVLKHVRELTSGRPIHTVIGGMHLINAGRERMDRTVADLRRLDVERLMPCHCTGFPAMARLWQEFPERCLPCRVGTVVNLEGVQCG